MIRSISICSANGVIGVNNGLPFNYPEDMKHFRKATKNSVVIMGRYTFSSMGSKPLPKRENIIISKYLKNVGTPDGCKAFGTIEEAMEKQSIILRDRVTDIWFIGGAGIYRGAMEFVSEIHLTITPDIINDKKAVHFPWINPEKFRLEELKPMSDNSPLKLAIYSKV